MTTAAPQLARFVSALRFADLPPAVVDAARRHLLDTFGVAIRGRAHGNATSSLRGLESTDGAAGKVAVWGGDRQLSAGYAALANGIAVIDDGDGIPAGDEVAVLLLR